MAHQWAARGVLTARIAVMVLRTVSTDRTNRIVRALSVEATRFVADMSLHEYSCHDLHPLLAHHSIAHYCYTAVLYPGSFPDIAARRHASLVTVSYLCFSSHVAMENVGHTSMSAMEMTTAAMQVTNMIVLVRFLVMNHCPRQSCCYRCRSLDCSERNL